MKYILVIMIVAFAYFAFNTQQKVTEISDRIEHIALRFDDLQMMIMIHKSYIQILQSASIPAPTKRLDPIK